MRTRRRADADRQEDHGRQDDLGHRTSSGPRTAHQHGGSNRAHIAASTVHRQPEQEEEDRGWLGDLGALVGFGGSGVGAYQAVVEMTNAMRTSGLSAQGLSAGEIEGHLLPTDSRLKHLGSGFSALGEMAGRAERGETATQAVGGGLLKSGTEALLGSDMVTGEIADVVAGGRGLQLSERMRDTFRLGGVADAKPTGMGTASSVAGLLGAGLKLTGAITGGPGEGPSGDWDWLSDSGDVVGTAGTFMGGGMSLLTEGITSGLGAAWTSGTNVASAISSGDTSVFEDQAKAQREGKAGPILQGYQMIADVVTGDADKVSEVASSGQGGGLAKLGSKAGGAAFALTEAAGLDQVAYEAVKWLDL